MFYDDDVNDIEVLWPSLHYAVPGCHQTSWPEMAVFSPIPS